MVVITRCMIVLAALVFQLLVTTVPVAAQYDVYDAQAPQLSRRNLLSHGKSYKGKLSLYMVWMEYAAVGSSWMTEMLDSHPAITSYGEMLENSPMHKISQQYHYWKKSLIGSDKIGAVGVKQKVDVLRHGRKGFESQKYGDRLPEVRKLLRDMDAKIICLSRRNWARHAIGETKHRAVFKECRSWTVSQGSACLQRAKKKYTKYNVKDIISYAKATRSAFRRHKDLCNDEKKYLDRHGKGRVLDVYYEDLIGKNGTREWNRILEFLEVQPRPLKAKIAKLSASKLSEEVANLDEVKKAIFKHMGDEGLALLENDDLADS